MSATVGTTRQRQPPGHHACATNTQMTKDNGHFPADHQVDADRDDRAVRAVGLSPCGACSGDTGLLAGEAFQVGVPGFLPRHARLCGWVAVVRDLLQHGGEDVDLRAPVGRVRPDGRGGMLIEGAGSRAWGPTARSSGASWHVLPRYRQTWPRSVPGSVCTQCASEFLRAACAAATAASKSTS
jgi:hypothetical protein